MKRLGAWFRGLMPSIQIAFGVAGLALAVVVALLAASVAISVATSAVDGVRRVASSVERDDLPLAKKKDPTATPTLAPSATPDRPTATRTTSVSTAQGLTATSTSTVILSDEMTAEEQEYATYVFDAFKDIGDEMDVIQELADKYGSRAYNKNLYDDLAPTVGKLAIVWTRLKAKSPPSGYEAEHRIIIRVARYVYDGTMKFREGMYHNNQGMIDDSATDFNKAGELIEQIREDTGWW